MNLRLLCTAALALASLTACDRHRNTEPKAPTTPPAPQSGSTTTTTDRTTVSGTASGTTNGADTQAAPGTTASSAGTSADADNSARGAASDAALTAKVKTALLADPQVKGMQIDVDTNARQVTLRGQVDSQQQADRAIEIVRGIEGVSAVNNELTVSRG
ncbi:MAG TPA: BON domain-containing protein [Candidatus Binatia bacterium]|nr:BON domain-containing protein [Candidatus Binatia bacterium]